MQVLLQKAQRIVPSQMTNTNTGIRIYALKYVKFGLSLLRLYALFHLLQAVSPELAPTRPRLLQR